MVEEMHPTIEILTIEDEQETIETHEKRQNTSSAIHDHLSCKQAAPLPPYPSHESSLTVMHSIPCTEKELRKAEASETNQPSYGMRQKNEESVTLIIDSSDGSPHSDQEEPMIRAFGFILIRPVCADDSKFVWPPYEISSIHYSIVY